MLGTNHIITAGCTTSVLYMTNKYLATSTNVDIFTNIHEFVSQPVISDWWLVGAVLLTLGSIAPDIDNKKSILGRYIHLPFEHRTWTHSIWPIIILSIVSIFWVPFMWFTLGYFLHIFYDALSRGGVAWLYPFTKYRKYGSNGAKVVNNHKVRLYSTGGKSEYLIVSLVVITTFIIYTNLSNNGVISSILPNTPLSN